MNQEPQENRFSIQAGNPLTVFLILVGMTLVLNGFAHIFFVEKFRAIQFPTDMIMGGVEAFLGVALLLNLIFGRFMAFIYCGLSFLGTPSLFSYAGIGQSSFRNLTIFYLVYYGICSTILLLDWLKNRKKTLQVR